MQQSLQLLLLFGAAAAVLLAGKSTGSYYESHPDCGHQLSAFVNGASSPELRQQPALGVCNWGLGPEYPQLQSRLGQCVSCSFTPADNPDCGRGTMLVLEPIWELAQLADCDWQGCWAGGQCVNGTAAETALCPDGSTNARCCPYKQYLRCCRLLPCVERRAPAGQCVVQEKDLLPGQQVTARVYAVPVASATDCYPYSFNATRVCQADRTLVPLPQSYDACTPRVVSRDVNGCAKLPGYTFLPGLSITPSSLASIPDATPWSLTAGGSDMRETAARDMALMAARCDLEPSCAAFESNGSTDLRYFLPTEDMLTAASSMVADPCVGVYAKSSLASTCARVPGYLFVPQRTVDLAAATNSSGITSSASGGLCTNCANATALALQCELLPSCLGFSNMDGLLLGPSSAVLAEQPLRRFTNSPCMGMYIRAAAAYPQEVLDLDAVLCGQGMYCSSLLQYSTSNRVGSAAAGTSQAASVTVTFRSLFSMPSWLTDSNLFSLGSTRQIPSITSLTVVCADGSTVLGGLPALLPLLLPSLAYLRIKDCGVNGKLPDAFSMWRWLRKLDLSGNRLSGQLPLAWANLTLGHLNLSFNQLTGQLPPSWQHIITKVPLPLNGTSSLVDGDATFVADLSNNQLSSSLDRSYVTASCLDSDLDLQLQGDQVQAYVAQHAGQRRTFLLQQNPGIAQWAGQYYYSVRKSNYDGQDHSQNMCGAYDYWIAVGVIWGVYGLCILALLCWGIWRWLRPRRRRRGLLTAPVDPEPEDTTQQEQEEEHSKLTRWVRFRRHMARLWSKRWVRRTLLLLRIVLLLVDLALDIWVTVWLFDDGDDSSANVCMAFIIATQGVIAIAVFVSLAPNLFGSWLATMGFAPFAIAAMPVVGPVLALANLRNPDIPLVAWRYLELVEFSVALLQAPAQSVTQTVVYVRQNQLANGMYLNHGLFIASIILSLTDWLIAVYKMCRYKRGPVWRVAIAFTHLDVARDPMVYRQGLLAPEAATSTSYLEVPLNAPSTSHVFENPLNRHSNNSNAAPPRSHPGTPAAPPDGSVSGRSSAAAGTSAMLAAAAAAAAASAAAAAGAGTGNGGSFAKRSEAGSEAPSQAGSHQSMPGPVVAHTYTPLTQPRYRPSLLATSAQRLSGIPNYMPASPSRLRSSSVSNSHHGFAPHEASGRSSGAPSASQSFVRGSSPPTMMAAAAVAAAFPGPTPLGEAREAATQAAPPPQSRQQSTSGFTALGASHGSRAGSSGGSGNLSREGSQILTVSSGGSGDGAEGGVDMAPAPWTSGAAATDGVQALALPPVPSAGAAALPPLEHLEPGAGPGQSADGSWAEDAMGGQSMPRTRRTSVGMGGSVLRLPPLPLQGALGAGGESFTRADSFVSGRAESFATAASDFSQAPPSPSGWPTSQQQLVLPTAPPPPLPPLAPLPPMRPPPVQVLPSRTADAPSPGAQQASGLASPARLAASPLAGSPLAGSGPGSSAGSPSHMPRSRSAMLGLSVELPGSPHSGDDIKFISHTSGSQARDASPSKQVVPTPSPPPTTSSPPPAAGAASRDASASAPTGGASRGGSGVSSLAASRAPSELSKRPD